VLIPQGDLAGVLAAYRKGLAIAKRLSAADPANTQWQTDVAVSCAKLSTPEAGLDLEKRCGYLQRAVGILLELKTQGRLMTNQDWIGEQLAGQGRGADRGRIRAPYRHGTTRSWPLHP